jgi:hypothetical protein
MGWAVVGAGPFVQGLAGVCPVKWMGHRSVVIVQELAELLFQVSYRCEIAPSHDFPHDDSKHRLNLVQPRAVLGQVNQPDAMGRIAQEFAASRL